ncbi:1,4-beta-xylanase, partial [Bacteroidales bacterium OttesenSCG-928-I21]|nr:1,4-beta-xylanase [Bacteroidales bacterium OttesenSCG-928-I21]
IVLENPVETRFLRITNTKDMDGKFSLSGFRVFGNGKGEKPESVSNFVVQRDKDDTRIFRFHWDKQEKATGYILRWGVKPEQLHNEVMIFDNQYEGRFFNRDSEYYFELTAF